MFNLENVFGKKAKKVMMTKEEIAAEAVQPVAIPCVREKGGNGL